MNGFKVPHKQLDLQELNDAANGPIFQQVIRRSQ